MKRNEFGRSMVEMLGVLAVIGVLSAGAVGGYNKAMSMHKMNKLVEQYEMMMQGLYQHQSALEQLHTEEQNINIVSYIQNLRLLPPSWQIDGNNFIDSFKNKTYVEIGQTWGKISFHIWLLKGQTKMCQNLLWQLIKPNSHILYYVRVNQIYRYGDLHSYSSKIKDMTLTDANELCSACEEDTCELTWLMQ